MTLLTFFKLLIKTELTLHTTILFLFWSLSSRAHRELVAYLRVLTDGADDIFIQQIDLGVDAFLQLLILLSKIRPPYRTWWLSSCQNRLTLNISSVISYPETILIRLRSWLTYTRHLRYPNTMLRKFHIGDALNQVLETLGKGNRRLNDLLLCQQHIVYFQKVKLKFFIVEFLSLKMLDHSRLQQKHHVEHYVSISAILQNYMSKLLWLQLSVFAFELT